jgi:deoxyribose-phosphate aldolase
MTALGRSDARLEHRLTSPNASLADLDAAVALAVEHDLAALVVSPWLLKAARRLLGRSRVRLGTMIGNGQGGQLLSVKAFEASKCLEQGATEIEVAINAGALISGLDEIVHNDLLAVIDMAHSALGTASVIIEAEPMREELVTKACRLAERAGADFVVTGSGSGTARRTIERVVLLRDGVGPRVQVKALGRFRSADELRAAGLAGATRVSTAFGAELLRAARDAVGAVAVA